MSGTGHPQQLAGQLQAWRAGQRLSLTAAGGRLGVDPTTYRRWEAGRRPYRRRLEVIAAVLGIDPKTVTELAGPAPQRAVRPAPSGAPFLVRARLTARLTRVGLGRLLHVSPGTVYRWEYGIGRPPAEILPGLARHLGLEREELDGALADHPPARGDGAVLPSLGAVLRDRGWSRRDVGELLSASPSSVYEWETGRTRVPSWALDRLATALGADPERLHVAARRERSPLRPGSSLAELRRRAGMTQREAAAVVGVSYSSVSRYEAGRRPVTLPLARAFARAYRVPLSRIVTLARVQLPPPLVGAPWTSDELPAILAALRRVEAAPCSEIARCVGVAPSTLRRWETGEALPCSDALAALEVRYQPRRGGLTNLAAAGTDGGRGRRTARVDRLVIDAADPSVRMRPRRNRVRSGSVAHAVAPTSVELDCGSVLTYEARTWVPAIGERVPCRRHGLCTVVGTRRVGGVARRSRPRATQPRSREDLLDFLRSRPVTTLRTLRKGRFSLAMVAAAQKDGLVELDLTTGGVALRSPIGGGAPASPIHTRRVG